MWHMCRKAVTWERTTVGHTRAGALPLTSKSDSKSLQNRKYLQMGNHSHYVPIISGRAESSQSYLDTLCRGDSCGQLSGPSAEVTAMDSMSELVIARMEINI